MQIPVLVFLSLSCLIALGCCCLQEVLGIRLQQALANVAFLLVNFFTGGLHANVVPILNFSGEKYSNVLIFANEPENGFISQVVGIKDTSLIISRPDQNLLANE